MCQQSFFFRANGDANCCLPNKISDLNYVVGQFYLADGFLLAWRRDPETLRKNTNKKAVNSVTYNKSEPQTREVSGSVMLREVAMTMLCSGVM